MRLDLARISGSRSAMKIFVRSDLVTTVSIACMKNDPLNARAYCVCVSLANDERLAGINACTTRLTNNNSLRLIKV